MYCINCGVHLADTEKACPLCATRCYHPDLPQPQADPLYPSNRYPHSQFNPIGVMSALTVLILIPLFTTLLCDLRLNGRVTWSGYVMGALLLTYEIFFLPGWFRKPNPIIFVPCGFLAVGLYLLYINLQTGAHWFLPFAFPVTGFLCILGTVLVTLLRSTARGKLFIYGGCILALGIFMPLMEYLIVFTFQRPVTGWSIYPFVAMVLLGGYLLFLGICRPIRESMQRKFFI